MVYILRFLSLLFGLSLMGCTFEASILSQMNVLSSSEIQIVRLNEALTQNKNATSRVYKVKSSQPIKSETLSVSDFVQKGTAQGLIMQIVPTDNPREYDLYVVVSAQPGTVELELPAHAVEFQDGSYNKARARSDNSTVLRSQTYSRIKVAQGTTCYIDKNSRVRCFGEHMSGEVGRLGDGGRQLRGLEVSLSNVTGTARFRKISGGPFSSCALDVDGVIYCWGDNFRFELGVGPFNDAVYEPQAVVMSPLVGEKKFLDFEANYRSTCAISAERDLYCWGWIDPTSGGVPVKIDLNNLGESIKAVQVSVGDSFVCGLTDNGKVFCFGNNDNGQLGNGAFITSSVPSYVDFAGLESKLPFVQVAVGEKHACALNISGKLYCWGSNGGGQLGDGTQVSRPSPVLSDLSALATSERLISVTASQSATCAISSRGQSYCFGWSEHILAADGQTSSILIPSPVNQSPLSYDDSVVDISLVDGRSCAETAKGAVYCWGNGLPVGIFKDSVAYIPQEVPTDVLPPGQFWQEIYPSADSHVVLLKSSDGTGYIWGATTALLGVASQKPRPLDTSTMVGSKKFKKLAIGQNAYCGIDLDDVLYCAGKGAIVGQGGVITSASTLMPVDTSAMIGSKKFADISMGPVVACGVATDGEGYCWGGVSVNSNLFNPVLGTGSTAVQSQPTSLNLGIISARFFSKIVTSAFHSCGLKTDKTVYCWGHSVYSRQSYTSASAQPTPQPLALSGMVGSTIWEDISGTGATFCGITTDKIAYCWGDSSEGQLGNGAFGGFSPSPVQVAVGGLLNSASPLTVAGFNFFSCGILDLAKNIYCWGGHGTSEAIEANSAVPVPVSKQGMMGNPIKIDGGKNLYITTDANKIYCLGEDCNLTLSRETMTLQYFEEF